MAGSRELADAPHAHTLRAMTSRIPAITLALLLAVAVAVIGGGARLARKVESVRVVRDHAPLRGFADSLGGEIARLERLYNTHLRRIAREAKPAQEFETRALCYGIVGIRQLSVLQPRGGAKTDTHLAIEPRGSGALPAPTFGAPAPGLPRAAVRLDEAALLNGAETWGWIEEPGKPLMFWQRADRVVIVLLIDPREVAVAIDRWLAEWSRGEFAAVRVAGGPDRLLGAVASALATAGEAHGEPDFLLPLRARFGTWQLASWDRTETRTSYHLPTLAAAAALGVFTALLGLAVAAQQRRAAALAAQRVSFVNRVSHELRTPLTNILLNLDLATEALDTAGEPPRRLALVREEAGRLGRLIENVLTFSRHEQGKLRADPHACIPARVIDAVVEQFAPSFHRRALTVRHTGDATAPCLLDADALAQILANLLSNVEKYVPGGAVEISSTLADGVLTITVADEGPGVAARDAERIFRPFERLGSRVNEGASGTGLGLAIARDLAASMGGTLRLRPAAKGAAFELRVPAPSASAISAVA